MKFLLILFFPCLLFAQPKKGIIYGRKSSLSINDSIIVWKAEESFRGKLFIGEKTITIGKDQYSIDSAGLSSNQQGTIYSFNLSLKGKEFRCFIYPAIRKKHWELLLDDNTSMKIYRIHE